MAAKPSTPAAVAAEPEAQPRKTFRLEPDTLATLTKANYPTENAAINGLLRELEKLRKKDAQAQIFAASQLANIAEANEVAKQWKEKHDAKAAELATLQNALRLIGQFLKPVDL